MDLYLKLAKTAVETYIREGKIITPPKRLPKEMRKKAGVFVSIYKRGLPRRLALATRGRRPREQVRVLRGCIGTYLPTQENIAQEIIKNAISSATGDPRFPPITQDELPDLIYSVDILSRPKHISKIEDLDVKRYGLIVSTFDGRRGLLLPDLPGIQTPQKQFQICCLKAGISPGEKVTLQTFTVKRHAEK